MTTYPQGVTVAADGAVSVEPPYSSEPLARLGFIRPSTEGFTLHGPNGQRLTRDSDGMPLRPHAYADQAVDTLLAVLGVVQVNHEEGGP